MNNTELFIEKYKELEHTVRSVYSLQESDSISYYLTHHERFKIYREKIAYCQKVRNFLQHEEKIEYEFAIQPSQAMIEFISKLIKEVKNQAKCKDIMITDIYYQTLNGNVLETIHTMKEKDISHVPILENQKVIGMFNKEVFLEVLDSVLKTSTFKDIQEHLAHHSNHYKFVMDNLYIEDLQEIFVSNYKNGNRVDLLLVTENGSGDETLLGIVSPWLVLQQEENN